MIRGLCIWPTAPSCLNQAGDPHTLSKHKPAFHSVCHFRSSQTPRRREGIKALEANVFKSVRYLGGIREVGAVCVCVMVDEMGLHMATITHTAPLIAADLPPRLQPSHL